MRNFTKIVLSLAMAFGLLGGVNSVSATKTYWAPSTANATWNSETKTMTWTAGDENGWHVMNSGLPTGDLSAAGYTKLHIEITSITNNISNPYITVKIASTDKADQYVPIYVGVNNIAFADYSTDIDFSKVTEISFWGSGDEGSAVITDCYLYNPVKTISAVTGFGDEFTQMSDITDGTKFVIGDGTNVIYFTGNQDSKGTTLGTLPTDSYFYFQLDKVTDSGVEGDNIYRVKIVNGSGTEYPNGISGQPYLNTPSWSALFAGASAKDGGHSYGQDADNYGLWFVTHTDDKGFSFQNVGKAASGGWLIVNGMENASQQYVKLYKSVIISSSTDLEKEDNEANDAIFALANATGYNSETGILKDGGWTFGTPVDLSDWDYLIITVENTSRTTDTYIRITDNDGNYVEKNQYAPGDQPEMYFGTYNNHNAACISMDYLRKNKGLKISEIKSLSFTGQGLKISSVYLTDYENTKLGPSRGRWTYYVAGDEVRNYDADGVGRFGTICLPYVASCAGAEVYSIASKSGSSISLSKVTGLLEAGKPYFYIASDVTGKDADVHNVNFFRADLAKYDAATAGTNNGLVGTFSEMFAPTGDDYYVLSNNKLYNVDSSVTVGANKAYVDISAITPSLARGVVDLDFNEPTGIETVANSQEVNANSKFFNLAGQRVAQPTKGLYIINGKKVLVK